MFIGWLFDEGVYPQIVLFLCRVSSGSVSVASGVSNTQMGYQEKKSTVQCGISADVDESANCLLDWQDPGSVCKHFILDSLSVVTLATCI